MSDLNEWIEVVRQNLVAVVALLVTGCTSIFSGLVPVLLVARKARQERSRLMRKQIMEEFAQIMKSATAWRFQIPQLKTRTERNIEEGKVWADLISAIVKWRVLVYASITQNEREWISNSISDLIVNKPSQHKDFNELLERIALITNSVLGKFG